MTTMNSNGTIEHVRGDDFELVLEDFKEDGVLINWSGWEFLMQVREKSSSPTTLIELKSGTDDVDMTVPGVIVLKKTRTEFEGKPAKDYFYDMQFTRPDGKVDTILRKLPFKLLEDVAR